MFRTTPQQPAPPPPPDPVKIIIPNPVVPALPGTTLHIITRLADVEQVPILGWQVYGDTLVQPFTSDSFLNQQINLGYLVGIRLLIDDGFAIYTNSLRPRWIRKDRSQLEIEIKNCKRFIETRNRLLSEVTGIDEAFAETDQYGIISTLLPGIGDIINDDIVKAVIDHHELAEGYKFKINHQLYILSNGRGERVYKPD